MRLKIVFLLVELTLFAVLQVHAQTVQELVTTHYRVELKDEQCGVEVGSGPDPVSVEVPNFSNGLRVMEAAADTGPEYMFTAIYLSPYGYLITNISGVTADVPRQCFWFYYIIYPNDPNTELLSAILLSNFYIPGPGYTIIWRFSKDLTGKENFTVPVVHVPPTMPVPVITVNYLVEYKDEETCERGLLSSQVLQVTIPTLGSALQVMENAADLNNSYRFKVTYFTNIRGYAIDGINVTENNPDTNCSWYFIIGKPDGSQVNPATPISKYFIPDEGYTIIMRYQNDNSPLILDSGAIKLKMSFNVILFISLLTISMMIGPPCRLGLI